jgi:putative tryptophan/tyrosine transport system substrate-binding protein
VRRREFILALAGAAWPLATRAQQPDRVRRIGVLTPFGAGDPEAQARHAAFLRGLQDRGWTIGRNVQIDYRSAEGNADHIRTHAAELVALAPDVILATGEPVTVALLGATRSVPIVFAQVPDPVASGLVASLAQPGDNVTGFTVYELGISAKWLELLKEIAPGLTRVAVLQEPSSGYSGRELGAIQSVAPSFGVELRSIVLGEADEVVRAVSAFARASNGGLIVPAAPQSIVHRDLIIELASRYRLPAVYSLRFFVTGGGLISYGTDSIDPYRRAADYVDRILRGEKPVDLPVQASTKYQLVINLKTAKELGIEVPPSLLARADEVIE